MSKKIRLVCQKLASLTGNRKGQTLAEYALILCFVAGVAITSMMVLGRQADNTKVVIVARLKVAQTSH